MSSFFTKSRKAMFVICALLIVSCIVAKANAATEAELRVPESENFPIEEGQTSVNFTFLLEETSEEFATNVNILASDLRDTKRGLSISANKITILVDNVSARQKFVLAKGNITTITVSVDTKDVKAGSYQGRIIANADNATDAELSLTIQVSQPFLYAALLDLGGIILGIIGTVFGVVIKVEKGARTRWQNTLALARKYFFAIGAFSVLLIVLYLTSLVLLYPTITDFGADGPIDSITAFFFGLGQYGGSSALGTAVKAIQDVRARRQK